MSALSLLMLASCALKIAPIPPAPIDAQPLIAPINWDDAGREVADVLSAYIQTPTVNPPGNELAGAEYLGSVLEAEGIPYEIVESAPGRGNLIARLDSDVDEVRPLCLMSHIDVVTYDVDSWTRPPLSGDIQDGYVWGRGALDMKSLGAIEMMTMVWLKRLNIPLKRDIILLAVADEEVDNSGAKYIADNKWGEIGCSQMINEGGIGLEDLLFDGQTVFPISVGEKGSLWARMVATGEPGHGSTPRPDSEAPAHLMAALERLNGRKIEVKVHDAFYELLSLAGQDKGGATGFILQRPFLVNTVVRPTLLKNPLTRAGMIDTVHLTGLGTTGENEPNVVASEVYAILDCRTMPDTTPAAHLAYIKTIAGPGVDFEVISSRQGNYSAWQGDPLYEAIARQVEARGAVPGPVISVGFTDSILFRPLGVTAYGFMPFIVTQKDMEGFHGDDERISIDNLRRGLQMMVNVVLEVSATGAAPTVAVEDVLP
ncbi:MAG: M20/M25/M40 family metallo-hydrolase [Myxococcota bacterium]